MNWKSWSCKVCSRLKVLGKGKNVNKRKERKPENGWAWEGKVLRKTEKVAVASSLGLWHPQPSQSCQKASVVIMGMEWRRQLKGLSSSSWRIMAVVCCPHSGHHVRRDTEGHTDTGQSKLSVPSGSSVNWWSCCTWCVHRLECSSDCSCSVSFGDLCFWKLISRVGLKWNPLCP